jgi:hypothetical protein
MTGRSGTNPTVAALETLTRSQRTIGARGGSGAKDTPYQAI